MSTEPFDVSGVDFNIINPEALQVDYPIMSGEWQGTGVQLEQLLGLIIKRAITDAAKATLDELLPSVAKLTGAMRESINNMFMQQVAGIPGFEDFNIDFSRPLVETPFYLRYHDIDWELNPAFEDGYKNPTTRGTKPFEEDDFNFQLKTKFARNMVIEFVAQGFDWSGEGLGDIF